MTENKSTLFSLGPRRPRMMAKGYALRPLPDYCGIVKKRLTYSC